MAKTDKDEELIHYYLTKADDNFHNEPIELQQKYPFVFFELGKHYKSIGQLVEAFDRLMAAQVIYEHLLKSFPTDNNIKKIIKELDKLLDDEVFDEMFENFDEDYETLTS